MVTGIEVSQVSETDSMQWPLLASLIWLGLLGALIANIQPMFLGGLADSFGLDAQQLGMLGGVELAGGCLASLLAPFWFSRINPRQVAAAALSVAVIVNLLTAQVKDYSILLGLRFGGAFLGTGVVYALALGMIGRLRNPDRLIAVAIIFQVFSLALGMMAIPVLLANWQLPGLSWALAITFGTGFLALQYIPCNSVESQQKGIIGGRVNQRRWLPASLLLGLVMYSIGLGAIWAFLERIGVSVGFASEDIGKALALSGFVGGLGALVAAMLGQRAGRLYPIGLGVGGQLLVCWLLSQAMGWSQYLFTVALFNFCWNLVLPYLMGAIGSADTQCRFMVLIPAAQAAGYAMGPVLAGQLIIGNAYSDAGKVSMVAFLLCLVIVVPLVRRLQKVS